jgi:ATP-dependent Lon protease
MIELGPRGTGKSFVFREMTPFAILISGDKTTVSNLFMHMGTGRVGLVGFWDVIAFDEVAGTPWKNENSSIAFPYCRYYRILIELL